MKDNASIWKINNAPSINASIPSTILSPEMPAILLNKENPSIIVINPNAINEIPATKDTAIKLVNGETMKSNPNIMKIIPTIFLESIIQLLLIFKI